MMTALVHSIGRWRQVFVLAGVLVILPASAQSSAQAAALREEFAQRRVAARSTLDAERRACYQRFAVTDCIERAESAHREEVAEIRRQELALNEQERKARSAARASNLESKSARAAGQPGPRPLDIEARDASRKRQAAEREAKAQKRAEQARKREADVQRRREEREQRTTGQGSR